MAEDADTGFTAVPWTVSWRELTDVGRGEEFLLRRIRARGAGAVREALAREAGAAWRGELRVEGPCVGLVYTSVSILASWDGRSAPESDRSSMWGDEAFAREAVGRMLDGVQDALRRGRALGVMRRRDEPLVIDHVRSLARFRPSLACGRR